MSYPEIKFGYVDILNSAEKLLWTGEASTYFYRSIPTKKEIIERAKSGFLFAPKTTRYVLLVVPKKINVPLKSLF